ncbi:hypothetical protein K505DRAFT_87548 [Melanomma pulvis-pyrius CBS 109.77]|uniref:Uncharacterized protein n=1 Tax=Melanomma pulvis-pyrius CBS 109.77 TaxID=1314802 RepID=A0A6A6XSA8_9PLEO|nr:hypothetical protein K505DRAFT_87548 [Melanomma pulvis-pyrius CBS 109.77]
MIGLILEVDIALVMAVRRGFETPVIGHGAVIPCPCKLGHEAEKAAARKSTIGLLKHPTRECPSSPSCCALGNKSVQDEHPTGGGTMGKCKCPRGQSQTTAVLGLMLWRGGQERKFCARWARPGVDISQEQMCFSSVDECRWGCRGIAVGNLLEALGCLVRRCDMTSPRSVTMVAAARACHRFLPSLGARLRG